MKSKFEGKTKIFRKDFDGRPAYSTYISQKNLNDEWESAFIKVQFNKGVEVADRTEIEVNNGWLKFYNSRDGKPVFLIHISDFSVINAPQTQANDSATFDAVLDDVPF